MQAIGASEKVFEYIDRQPKFPNSGHHAPDQLEGRLEFQNVSFSYPSRPNCKVLEVSRELVGPGGSLIDSSPFVQRVVGSNPALAAT